MITIVLDTTVKTLVASLGGAVASTQPQFTVHYADSASQYFVEGSEDGDLDGANPVTICTAPQSGYRRIVKAITIQNSDSLAVLLTVALDNNGTPRKLFSGYLQPGDVWTLEGTYNENGELKQSSGGSDISIIAGDGITIEQAGTQYTVSLYREPTVDLTIGGGIHERGEIVADITVDWTTNKTMTTRVLDAPVPEVDRDRGAGGSDTYTHVGANLEWNSADITYGITVGDGVNTAYDSASVLFLNRRYYGVDTRDTLSGAQVLELAGVEFASGRATTKTFDCTGGRYIWICYPDRFGAARFTIGGLEVTFVLTTQDVTNASGYTESFRCYRSINLLNGADVQVVVT